MPKAYQLDICNCAGSEVLILKDETVVDTMANTQDKNMTGISKLKEISNPGRYNVFFNIYKSIR